MNVWAAVRGKVRCILERQMIAFEDHGRRKWKGHNGKLHQQWGQHWHAALISDQVLLFAIKWRAEPLCIAKWSVLSLLIRYCGSSLEA